MAKIETAIAEAETRRKDCESVGAVLVRAYRQAGMPLPTWLIGDAARKFLDHLDG